MPKIPQMTARGETAVYHAMPVDPRAYGAQLGQTFGELGHAFWKIREKVQAQQDELDLARATGEFEAGMASLKLGLKTDTDYDTHADRFQQGATQLQEQLAKSLKTRVAQEAFTAYTSKRLPSHVVDVAGTALERQIGAQQAQLPALRERYLTQATTAATDQERAEAEATYTGLVTKMAGRGILDPKVAEAERLGFLDKVADGIAIRQSETDPAGPRAVAERLRNAEGIFARLEPTRREGLAKALDNEADTRDQRRLEYDHAVFVQAHQEMEQLGKAIKTNQDLELGDLYLRAMSGEDITPRILARGRLLDPDKIPAVTHFARWYSTMGEPDNPEVVNKVLRLVTADVPLISAEALASMKGLSNETRKGLMFHIQSVRRALQSEGRSLRMQELAQASAGLSQFFDKSAARMESQRAQLAGIENLYREEFLRRTIHDPQQPGRVLESPYVVYQELVNRAAPQIAELGRMTYTQKEQALPARYRGPQGEANLKADVESGALKDLGQADMYARRLRELEDLRASEKQGIPNPSTAPGAPSAPPPGGPPSQQRKRL